MTAIFPGMDPYLEHPELWPDVHSRLIAALADAITPLLPPHYCTAVETRSYVAAAELPAADVVRETYLEVREPPGDEAIAVIEILSPFNKQLDLREAIPVFALPLRPGDPEIPVDIGSVLSTVYERARYRQRIRYENPPPPPALAEQDWAWIDQQLRNAGLR